MNLNAAGRADIICRGQMKTVTLYHFNPINSAKNSELYMQLVINLCSDNHNQLNKVLVKDTKYILKVKQT